MGLNIIYILFYFSVFFQSNGQIFESANNYYSNGDYSGVFEENMVICVESYIGEVGGKEGVKLEDQYLITKNGLKLLINYLCTMQIPMT